MQITIKATGIELTQAITNYVNEKIGGLEKYLKRLDQGSVEARVEVGKITKHHNKGDIFRAEINLTVPGKVLRAEEENSNLYAAIDLMHDEIKRQIVSFKEKGIEKNVRQARKSEE
ncbi:MAG: Ribosomal subunit interface protein [Candidatus Magasanikbacteria bacterium GW2011_GWC2_40_17]|uniref:Ribosomal subunit interface protein n=1 Tax=Candidatus Magasanikbacteria bacterium GW2011_GWA2_42_32 TaxID=1619039 RepID=A0A0G1A925_9BACT|nr:MAG: Ribosomal subunit interface protein [Candidatus Magasanikbacteria bacterium GW2011_GWC2_40_17]KKS57454.1 MAG: Ribosomal subunit interface protein [Candidatus Magasanikbacteria bacterium GW2011_GWA2_42_32]OGH85175.1 MAG: ribosomal subunit interface protein [Candidatus Magasanikbacteria bacterium RIFOXYB2_FULL_38_10]